MAPRKADITRRMDLAEKLGYGLLISLLVCLGFHRTDAGKAIIGIAESAAALIGGPAGCASQPAYAVGIHAAIASDDDLLPKTGGYSRRTNTATKPADGPAPPTNAPAP